MSVGYNFSNIKPISFQSWYDIATLWAHDDDDYDELLRALLSITGSIAISLSCGTVLRNTTTWRDTGVLAVLMVFMAWRSIYAHIVQLIPTHSKFYLYALPVALVGCFITISPLEVSRRRQKPIPATQQLLKPLIFPCRTTHARLFPTKHSFSYSYLFVGIPIGWNKSAGLLLSTDLCSRRTWFSVHAEDYLARGLSPGGLRAKLDAYLTSIDVTIARFPHAYLVTAPRILGFSFNPVSFWYLYDDQLTLAAMILEVNNTFDERRMYYMDRTRDGEDADSNFTMTWLKDFHVSPFNNREGSYSLAAKDPRPTAEFAQVDNNIVLRSNDGKPKVVARVFSAEAAVDPAKMSSVQTYLFLMRWWWVGFMTNPRILREARTLWVKKLQVFYRPEVRASSIGRNESREEAGLEPFFREYLRRVVTTASYDVNLVYMPAAGPERGKEVLITSVRSDKKDTQHIEIRVLTPAFYSELGRAGSSVVEAFQKFGIDPAPDAKMVEVTNTSKLLALFENQEAFGSWQPSGWTLLKQPHLVLRNGLLATIAAAFHLGTKEKVPKARIALTDLDGFVVESMPDRHQIYSRLVARIVLTDRIAWGFLPLLRAYALIIWAVLLWLGARQINYMIEEEVMFWTLSRSVFILTVLHCSRAMFEIPR